MPKKPTKLKYVAKHGEHIIGVPAADFEAESSEQAKELVATGLYEEVAERTTKDKDDD